MSDQEIGKKEVEFIECEYFVYAYKDIGGERLDYRSRSERPDFIYAKPNGELVGIELVWVEGYRFPDYLDYFAVDDVLDRIWSAGEKKDTKRSEDSWKLKDNTILVLQSGGCELAQLERALDEGWQQNFEAFGFLEIWLGDFTQESLEAFGDIDLLGLYPSRWFGHLHRPNLGKKPYG